MNFMVPIENIYLLPGRDDILKNLFGLFERADEITQPILSEKKKKSKKQQLNQEKLNVDDDDMDINIF